jgi:pSer/pThr/pTyr-binding forkhead associated (FHA) protein
MDSVTGRGYDGGRAGGCEVPDEPTSDANRPKGPAAKPCPSCGASAHPDLAFCSACGARIRPTAPAAAVRGRLVLIRNDGSEGGAHPLHAGSNIIGRSHGRLFGTDAYLSPRHAELEVRDDDIVVRDLGSLNGTFMKITVEEPLASGDVFRIGQALLRFETLAPPEARDDGTVVLGTPDPGFWGRLSVIIGRDGGGTAVPLCGDTIDLGRTRGEILFPEDGYVSSAHARLSVHDGGVWLVDAGSSNGTFLCLHAERIVPNGTQLLMGQQLFRAELR